MGFSWLRNIASRALMHGTKRFRSASSNVRRVPLLVLIGDQARPGFAAEVLRVGYDASSYIVDVAPQRLHIGPLIVPIDADAALRIVPRPPAAWRQRTVSAASILADDTSGTRLAGHIVLIGSGAPEVGGLRPTPVSATTPSVQIQADAIETLAGDAIPRRPPWVCAVTRRRFPVGASPTRRPLRPEAIGAVMEVTKWLKPSISVSRIGGSASVQAATRVNAEQALYGAFFVKKFQQEVSADGLSFFLRQFLCSI